jgi:hypothetical protein
MTAQEHMQRAAYLSRLAFCASCPTARKQIQLLAYKHTVLSEDSDARH